MSPGPFILCGLLSGADYGSAYVNRKPGVVEVGPVASRIGQAGGALGKAGLCSVGEVLLKDKPGWVKWTSRGLQVLVTGAIVRHNLRTNAHR